MKISNYYGLTVAAMILLTVGFVSARRTRFRVDKITVQGLPEHGLSIVGPADHSYDELVQSLSKDNPDAGLIRALHPYSVFIKNTSRKAVVACLLRWELIGPEGAAAAETTGFIATWRLMNQDSSGAGGTIIKPGATRFFPPSNLEVFQWGDGAMPPLDPARDRIQVESAHELAARFGHYSAVKVSLDGAFFEDGTFVGPDTTGFFAHVEALRNARYDMYHELGSEFAQGKSAGEVFRRAESLGRESLAQSDPPNLYDRTKKSVAREILNMREQAGDRETLEWVRQSLRTPPVELKRRGSVEGHRDSREGGAK